MANVKDNLLIAAGVVASVLLALTVTMCWPHIRNEFFVLVGNRNEAGGYYGFWSGFAGASRVFEYAVIGLLVYWHHTCHHSASCLRLGKYPAAGGLFKLCHKHHPDLGGEKPGNDIIHRLHRERA